MRRANERRDEAAQMVISGQATTINVASRFGVSTQTVLRWCQLYAKENGVEYKPQHGGRPMGHPERKCKVCGERKPYLAFSDGFDLCRACQKERRMRWTKELQLQS